MNLPNRLTIARLVLVPLFVLLMSVDHFASYLAAYVTFTVASLTDYYDGKIARRDGLITNFGKLMDPLADKILVTAAFVMLMKIPALTTPGWAIVAILAREFLVTGARSLAAADGSIIAANATGKTKTVIQMVHIYTFLFLAIVAGLVERWLPDYAEVYGSVLSAASMYSIIFVAAFTVYSGIEFARSNWAALNLSTRS